MKFLSIKGNTPYQIALDTVTINGETIHHLYFHASRKTALLLATRIIENDKLALAMCGLPAGEYVLLETE